MTTNQHFSRREQEVMDIVYRLGTAGAAEIRAEMVKPPTDAAVRSVLRILVDKGHLAFEQDGARYLYRPTAGHESAGRKAMARLLDTFFDGSAAGAMAALLDLKADSLTEHERGRLQALIDRASEEGR